MVFGTGGDRRGLYHVASPVMLANPVTKMSPLVGVGELGNSRIAVHFDGERGLKFNVAK